MTFGVNVVAWLVGLLLRLKLKDCSTLAANAVINVLALNLVLANELSQNAGDFWGVICIPISLSTPIVFATHFLWIRLG